MHIVGGVCCTHKKFPLKSKTTISVWHYQALENLNAVCAFKWVLSHNNKITGKGYSARQFRFFSTWKLSKKNSLAPLNCKLNACVLCVCVLVRENSSSCELCWGKVFWDFSLTDKCVAMRGRSCQTNNFQFSPIITLMCLHSLNSRPWIKFWIEKYEKWELFDC